MRNGVILGLGALVVAAVAIGLALVLGGHDRGEAADGGGASAPTGAARAGDLVAGGPDADTPGAREGVEAAVAPTEVPVEEEAPAGVDPRETVLVGRLVGTEGEPLPNGSLTVIGSREPTYSIASAEQWGAVHWRHERAVADDATFRVEGVPAHGLQLHLRAEAPGRAAVELPAVLAVPGEVTDLGDLELPLGGRVQGVVVNELGVPVPDASVRWTRAHGGNWSFLQRAALGAPVGRTSATGEFRANALPPGLVSFAVTTPTGASAWSLPVRVRSGEETVGVEVLVPDGRPIVGDVLDPTGQPVAGATVAAWPQGTGPARLTGTTDESGRFELVGGSPGQRYQLSAMAEGFRDRRYVDHRVPAPGEPESPVLIDLLPVVPVRLHVLDGATSLPVAGAEVAWSGNLSVTRSGSRETNAMRFSSARVEAVTGEDGIVVLDGVRDLSRGVLVRAEGYAPRYQGLGYLNHDAEVTAVEAVARLEPGVAITVHTRDLLGPVPGAAVELRVRPSDPFSSRAGPPADRPDPHGVNRPLVARAVADAEGVAVFADVPPDGYFVTASAEGYADVMADPLFLETGLTEWEVTVQMTRAASLSGEVLVRGAPTAGQFVVAVAADDRTHVTVSGEDGTYRLDRLPPGEVKVVARRELPTSGLELVLAIPPADEEDRRVTLSLGEGESRRLDLEGESAGARLSGTLLVNHFPHAGATIKAEPILELDGDDGGRNNRNRNRWFGAPGMQSTTGPDGDFVLEGLYPGPWRVYAELTDSRGARLRVAQMDVDMGDDDRERDLLGAATGLAVDLVIPGEGNPPGRLWVILRPNEDRGGVPGFPSSQRWSLNAGRSLRAEAELLPEGNYWLEVMSRPYYLPQQELQLYAGSPEELELELIER